MFSFVTFAHFYRRRSMGKSREIRTTFKLSSTEYRHQVFLNLLLFKLYFWYIIDRQLYYTHKGGHKGRSLMYPSSNLWRIPGENTEGGPELILERNPPRFLENPKKTHLSHPGCKSWRMIFRRNPGKNPCKSQKNPKSYPGRNLVENPW